MPSRSRDLEVSLPTPHQRMPFLKDKAGRISGDGVKDQVVGNGPLRNHAEGRTHWHARGAASPDRPRNQAQVGGVDAPDQDPLVIPCSATDNAWRSHARRGRSRPFHEHLPRPVRAHRSRRRRKPPSAPSVRQRRSAAGERQRAAAPMRVKFGAKEAFKRLHALGKGRRRFRYPELDSGLGQTADAGHGEEAPQRLEVHDVVGAPSHQPTP